MSYAYEHKLSGSDGGGDEPEFPVNPEPEPEMLVLEISSMNAGMFMQSFMTIMTQLRKL